MLTPHHPATQNYLGLPGYLFTWIIFLAGISLFAFIIYRRSLLLRSGQADPRLSELGRRVLGVITFGLFQKRQPRYFWAGVIHILIFSGFVVLGLRSLDLISHGLGLPVLAPLMNTAFGHVYGTLKDLFELIVFAACFWAMLRRAIVRPERYSDSHAFEAYFVLCLISLLMLTDMAFEGAGILLGNANGQGLPASQWIAGLLSRMSRSSVERIYISGYWLHLLVFFFFLNFLPLGKHFHIITALPNVFFRKLKKGALKPARWDVEDMDDLETLGVGKIEDFTWKNILDLYTCTECGRCSDHCPANAIGRPLSPKRLTMNLRDHAYGRYPVFPFTGKNSGAKPGPIMVGGVISTEAIWSCTTCGACEEECPVFIEYIDKIIDMRRHLIETARNPTSFNQVLMHVEKTGNPFGKPAAKRADWIQELNVPSVRILGEGDETDVLYFVDSYASFDPAAQRIASAIVKGLNLAGVDFGVLGPLEKDSGHQVRRIGEEGLFQLLLEENSETLKSIQFNRIITTDPHTFNTLKKDYPGNFRVFHYTQFFQSMLQSGQLKPGKALDAHETYTYHDPCYLGRHNSIYDAPRDIIRSIPGMNFREMTKSRDRSFCCGGADIVLWYEIEQEKERMAVKRVQMARDAGADVIVTACPFCLIHFEDAIKSGGLEKDIRVVDLMELFISTL
ncbi:MAG: (Fe-S)-binding protein [Desulfatiglandaceae bacterium]